MERQLRAREKQKRPLEGKKTTKAKRTKKNDPLLCDLEPLHPKEGVGCSKKGLGEGNSFNKPPKDAKYKFLRELPILKEEPIAVEELEDTAIPMLVAEMGWEKVIAKPRRINLTVVYEFYHNIDSQTFTEKGVKVRGKIVHFSPKVLNEYFGTKNIQGHKDEFPPDNEYLQQITPAIAEELRKYPIGKWRGGQQKIDHRELSAELAFWNVFVSRAVSPRMQHQKLRKDHPYIILSLNRAKRVNLGLLMCRSLEYHITRAKQIVFPSTITALCEQAGVNVAIESDVFMKSASTLGVRAFNKIAMARGEKSIRESEGATNCGNGKKNAVGKVSIPSIADGSNSVVRHEGGLQNDILLMLLDGQRQIINLLKKIDNRLPGDQGDIIPADDDLTVNDNDAVDANQVLGAADNADVNVDGNHVVDDNGVLGLNGNADQNVDDNVVVNEGNTNGNDSLGCTADVSLEEHEEIRGDLAVNVDENKSVGGEGDLLVLANVDIDNVWTEVLSVGKEAVNAVKADEIGDSTDCKGNNEVMTGVVEALEVYPLEKPNMSAVDKSDGTSPDGV